MLKIESRTSSPLRARELSSALERLHVAVRKDADAGVSEAASVDQTRMLERVAEDLVALAGERHEPSRRSYSRGGSSARHAWYSPAVARSRTVFVCQHIKQAIVAAAATRQVQAVAGLSLAGVDSIGTPWERLFERSDS